MSIKSIYFENYKAFKSGEISFAPLSILLGTNSSGKSSIIKLILMLTQSADMVKNNKSLITTGELTDLGDLSDIFHNQDINKNLKIELKVDNFSLDSAHNIREKQLSRYCREVVKTNLIQHLELARSNGNNISLNKHQNKIVNIYQNFDDDNSLEEQIKKTKYVLTVLRNQSTHSDKSTSTPNFIDESLLDVSIRDINKLYKSHCDLLSLKNVTSFGYNLSYYKKNIIFRDIYLKFEDKVIFKINLFNWKTKKNQVSFESELTDSKVFNNELAKQKNLIILRSLRLQMSKEIKGGINRFDHITKYGPSIFLLDVFNKVIMANLSDLSTTCVKHVGPLRFQPKRYFLLEDNNNTKLWNTSDGEKLSSILHKNKEIKEQINGWLKKFDLEVDISQIKNIIHSIKVKDKGITLDITDVGFGISQVLPVILQPFLAPDNGIIIIEQPEVHIHPKMQSELADFFISIINNSNKRFIIETHSEAFLKRLRRRIAENQKNMDGSISNEKVAIQFIEKRVNKQSTATIENTSISQSGMFEWPKDFKENDVDDSIAFMNLQG